MFKPQFKIRKFSEPKVGESKDSCQDAMASKDNRFAIADGATCSFQSKTWAMSLVDYFCEGNEDQNRKILMDPNCYKEWLFPIQQEWINKSKADSGPSHEYWTKNKIARKEPAAATFVGLEISEKIWRAITIGDSCLFHISNGECKCYPDLNRGDFGDHPDCFCSFPGGVEKAPQLYKGKNKVSDTFVLATDALAKWVLVDKGSENTQIAKLLNLKNDEDFQLFVHSTRNDRCNALDNDDTSLMIVEVCSKGDSSFPSSGDITRPPATYDTEKSKPLGNAYDINHWLKRFAEVMSTHCTSYFIMLVLFATNMAFVKQLTQKVNSKDEEIEELKERLDCLDMGIGERTTDATPDPSEHIDQQAPLPSVPIEPVQDSSDKGPSTSEPSLSGDEEVKLYRDSNHQLLFCQVKYVALTYLTEENKVSFPALIKEDEKANIKRDGTGKSLVVLKGSQIFNSTSDEDAIYTFLETEILQRTGYTEGRVWHKVLVEAYVEGSVYQELKKRKVEEAR